jgi:hypothetical protein
MKIAPTVFLLLLCLCGCKDRYTGDFETVWAGYEPAHVSGWEK